jgi:TolB-like protein/class 3 adenylate cyclase
MDRKLAAILAADVVGYSAQMERDERGTFARLKAHRTEIFEPEIQKHQGRIFKLMGDGLLAEFGSVVDAVECALAVQRELGQRNVELAANERIELRIGINLGDVIVEGLDRYGEGVNIAARLEQLAVAGGICLSRTVVDHLGNKLPISIEAMGKHQVKNIAKPVEVYRVRLEGTGSLRGPAPHAKKWFRGRQTLAMVAALVLIIFGALAWLGPWSLATDQSVATGPTVDDPRPSLVVLPFDSLSDDKHQAYLAEGITEDLTTALARVPGLFVISRNSASDYKDKEITPAQFAKELGVRYFLEGSIRRAGDEMRINAQLIDAATSGHLWAERFDGAWDDVFKLQDQVVGNVATALKLRLVDGPRLAKTPGSTANPTAYDLYLRGLELNYTVFPAEAAAFYSQATALDPNFGMAWAELAWVYWASAGEDKAQQALGAATYEETVSKLKGFMSEAEKNPSSTYYQLMASLLVFKRMSADAVTSAERAIALDPSDYWAYEQMSLALAYDGRAVDAKAYLEAARRVDPRQTPPRNLLAGLVSFSQGQFADAVASLEKLDTGEFAPSDKRQRLFLLAAAYAYLGNMEKAATARTELETLGDANGLRAIGDLPFTQSADIDRLLVGLGKAGVPDLPFGFRWGSNDRLRGDEIKSLVFGYEFRGRELDSGEPYFRSTGADGRVEASIGSWSPRGRSRVEGDFLCTQWDSEIGEGCAVVYRNPRGSPELHNEYVLLTYRQRVEFSVVQ